MSEFYRDRIVTGELRFGNRRQNVPVKQIAPMASLIAAPTADDFNLLVNTLKDAGLMALLGVEVTGTVTDDSVEATPIAGALVQILGVDGKGHPTAPLATTHTDVDGGYTFVLKHREYSTYMLVVTAEGYESAEQLIDNIDGEDEVIDVGLTEIKEE